MNFGNFYRSNAIETAALLQQLHDDIEAVAICEN